MRTERAEACPGVAEMAARVTRMMGRDPFAERATRTIEGVVTREEGAGWIVRLYVRDERGTALGTSELRSAAAGCDSIATAAAIAVALAIDPTAQLQPEAPDANGAAQEPSGAPPPPPPRTTTTRAHTAPTGITANPRPALVTAAPRPADRIATPASWERGGDLTARFILGFGLLPQAAPGVALAANVHLAPRWTLSAGGFLLPEVPLASSGFPSPSDPRYAFGLAAAWATGCFDAVHLPWLSVAACAGAMLGAAHSVASQVMADVPGNVPWLGLALGPRVTVRVVGPLLVELAADGLWSALNYRFTLRHYVNGMLSGTDVVFAQPDLAAIVHLGVGAHFW